MNIRVQGLIGTVGRRIRRSGRAGLGLLVMGMFSLLVSPAGAQQHKPVPPPAKRPHFVSIYPNFQLTAAGDAIIVTPTKVHENDPAFMGVVKAVRQGDAAVLNFEGSFAGKDTYPIADSGGTWIYANPGRLKDLQWIGFNLFSVANNHSSDFGTKGILETMKVFEKGGAAFAGIGANLGGARAPAYLSTGHGRVALISCTSTYSPQAPAGQARPDFRGRPGLSVLHHETHYIIDAADFAALKHMAANRQLALVPTRQNSPNTLTVRFNNGGTPFEGAAVTFSVGAKPAVVSAPDPRDVAAITAQIRDAREQADYVVVYMHNHEQSPTSNSAPAQFTVTFAHDVIDAGADVFAMSGPHILRGIEIYKGKVIMYSLGNFIFENDLVAPQPQDVYQLYGLGLHTLPSHLFDVRSDYGTKMWPAAPQDWQSVVADVMFRDGKPAEVKLTPIVLGYGLKRPDRGIPRLADAATGTRILERLQKLSAPFGTKISIRNGVGVIEIQNPSTH